MIDTTFRKVTVFVTRGAAPCREILTFIHPFGGRQLPAGSVEKGEAPIESARREVWEETGVRDIEQIALLDVATVQIDGIGFLRAHLGVHSDADENAPVLEILPRGYKVSINEQQGGWVHVSHRTYDFNATPEAVLHEVSGWVPEAHVARVLERYHYHIIAAADGRQSWTRAADGHVFQVKWVPLTPPPRLVFEQQDWLDARHMHLSVFWSSL